MSKDYRGLKKAKQQNYEAAQQDLEQIGQRERAQQMEDFANEEAEKHFLEEEEENEEKTS